MNSTKQSQLVRRRIDEPAQEPCADAFDRYLIERGYARKTVRAYLGYASHFLQWTQRNGLDLLEIDEAVVTQFLDDHLSRCDCGWPTRGDRRDAHAALRHLIVVLRTLGVVAPRAVIATPVDEELRRFDDYMERVRGLAPKTRSAMLRIVRELLWQRFKEPGRELDISARSSATCHALQHRRPGL
jgi:hypothetical protein